MSAFQDPLYQQLKDFPFDALVAKRPMSARLRSENGWSAETTDRAIEEYRRFLYLAIRAGHPVSPSVPVDQVWHTHLIYTRSYWDELCGKVLMRPLHHEPSQGGAEEATKYAQWYRKTLKSYRDHFLEEPPTDLWPRAPQLTHGHRSFSFLRQANQRLHRAVQRFVNALPCVGFPIALTSPFELPGPDFVVLYFTVLLVGVLVALMLRYVLRKEPTEPTEARELTAIEMAYLCEGSSRSVQTALLEMVEKGTVTIEGDTIQVIEQPKDPNLLEYKIFASIEKQHGSLSKVLTELRTTPIGEVEGKLIKLGLLETSDRFFWARWVPALVILGVALFGTAKILIGIARAKPVLLLVVLVMVTIGLMILLLLQPRRTRAGNNAVERLKDDASVGNIHGLSSSFAILGVAALVGQSGTEELHNAYDAWEKQIRSTQVTSANGCGSGGGGGDSGGGGCGGGSGCGGCGG